MDQKGNEATVQWVSNADWEPVFHDKHSKTAKQSETVENE